MKILYCYKCGTKVAEISKGVVKKNSQGICSDCLEKIKMKKTADDFSKIGKQTNNFNDALNSFKNIFNGR